MRMLITVTQGELLTSVAARGFSLSAASMSGRLSSSAYRKYTAEDTGAERSDRRDASRWLCLRRLCPRVESSNMVISWQGHKGRR